MPKHLPQISIEKYAAYLDGNLPVEEMQQMDAFIQNDPEMQAFVEAGNYIDAISDTAFLNNNDLVPFEVELPTIELPPLGTGLPFEPNSYIDDFFPIDSDRFGGELGSLIDDDVSHQEFLDETSHMNDSFEIEDNPISLATCKNVNDLITESSHELGIYEGEFGLAELGQPTNNTHDDLTNNDLITLSPDDSF